MFLRLRVTLTVFGPKITKRGLSIIGYFVEYEAKFPCYQINPFDRFEGIGVGRTKEAD